MNKKKGFTLIELLAVIVLLAILVIIAVPNVIKMLNNTKQKTFMVEVENIIKGAKNAYATNTLNGIDKTCYSLSELSDYVDKDFTGYSGSVLIDASNNTSRVWLANDKYIVAGSYSGNIEVVPLTSPVTATTTCEEMYVVANGEGEQVTTTLSTLIDRIDGLEEQVNNPENLGTALEGRTTALETRTTDLVDRMTALETTESYSTTTMVNASIPNSTTTVACSLNLPVAGVYMIAGSMWGTSWGANVSTMCQLIGAIPNSWYVSDAIRTTKTCSAFAYAVITEPTTVQLRVYQSSGSAKNLDSCSINAIRIK